MGFFTFMLLVVIITNQTHHTASVNEDIELGEPSHSIGGEETPIQTCPLPPRPPTESSPSPSSLTPPERQVPNNSPNRRRSNVNPEASSSSSGQDNAFLNVLSYKYVNTRPILTLSIMKANLGCVGVNIAFTPTSENFHNILFTKIFLFSKSFFNTLTKY